MAVGDHQGEGAALTAAEGAQSTERLGRLLDEVERLRRWRALELPDDLRAYLTRQEAAAGGAALDVLLQWRGAGGDVALVPGVSRRLSLVREISEDVVLEVLTASCEAEEEASEEALTELCEPGRVEESSVTPPVEEHEEDVGSERPLEEREEEAAPVVSPPPATETSLSALQRHFATGGALPTRPVPAEDWHRRLDAILGKLLPSEKVDVERERVLDGIEASSRWARLPRGVQRLLVGMMACRLRALQDEHRMRDHEMDQAFSTLTRYSKEKQPGFVRGLMRSHEPEYGSWSEDADRYWELLSDLLPDADNEPSHEELIGAVERMAGEIDRAPEAAREAVRAHTVRTIRTALQGGVRVRDPRLLRLAEPFHDDLVGREFRTLRRAIREAFAEDEEAEDASTRIPEDWAWWGRTRGRVGMLVGGDPREPNRRRLEQVFGFASLSWEATTGKPQALQSLRNRILARSVDVVFILGAFVGHQYDDVLLPACREAGVDWVHVDHGYGAVRIQASIERFLQPLEG